MSHKFYHSRKWLTLRFEVIKKYGKKCMACGDDSEIQVDHIIARSIRPELELDFNNLQILCKSCNFGKYTDSIDFRPKEMINNDITFTCSVCNKTSKYPFCSHKCESSKWLVDNVFLDIPEIMNRFQITRMTVYRWIKLGKLKSYQIGRKHLFKERELPSG